MRHSVEATVEWELRTGVPGRAERPSAACTTVLRHDFELVEACPEGGEFEGKLVPPPGDDPLSCVCP